MTKTIHKLWEWTLHETGVDTTSVGIRNSNMVPTENADIINKNNNIPIENVPTGNISSQNIAKQIMKPTDTTDANAVHEHKKIAAWKISYKLKACMTHSITNKWTRAKLGCPYIEEHFKETTRVELDDDDTMLEVELD